MTTNTVEAPEAIRTPYERLASLNVNDKLEKKNGLSYLSWAWAVDQLLRADPLATWEYGQPTMYGDTMMVFCTVTAFNQPRTMQLPVMDHRNKAIANPDAFQVNTAMQRCLVKAIALHGLGLYVYAGEDLPPGEEAEEKPKAPTLANVTPNAEGKELYAAMSHEEKDMLDQVATTAARLVKEGKDAYAYLHSLEFDIETKLALNTLLDAPTRAAIKKQKPAQALASQP